MPTPSRNRNPCERRVVTTRAAFLAGGLLWVLIFVLSCRLSATGMPALEADGPRSVAGALLGESRTALGWHLFELADLYFHKGVEHHREHAIGGGIFSRTAALVSPRNRTHVDGAEVAEIMPWLSFATRVDPHNVDSCLVAAFWLSTAVGKPQAALDLLTRAQGANPFNDRIQLEKGRVLLREGRVAEAGSAFDAGLAFWPGGRANDDEDARLDRAALLLYRALIHEAAGEADSAVSMFQEIMGLYPERQGLRERIAAIRAGLKPSRLASGVWRAMLAHDDEDLATCHVHAAPDEHDSESVP